MVAFETFCYAYFIFGVITGFVWLLTYVLDILLRRSNSCDHIHWDHHFFDLVFGIFIVVPFWPFVLHSSVGFYSKK